MGRLAWAAALTALTLTGGARAQAPPPVQMPAGAQVPGAAGPRGLAKPAPTATPATDPALAIPPVPTAVATPLPVTVLGAPAGTPSAAAGSSGGGNAENPKTTEADKPLADSLHQDDNYGLKALFDSLHPPGKSKPWYEKLNVRGYTQFRFTRTLDQDLRGGDPNILGDRSVNGSAENISIRRARFILFGDVSEHLGIYAQPDFANLPTSDSSATFFGQLRDLYGDVYLDKEKVHRLRVGLSKVPFGFENMQSSQNRTPLDRTDPINTAVSPNERDLGVFYYWTPVEKQQLLRDLVDGGLKGSGNYGVFGFGVYNGQGGSQVEKNLNLHAVARVTWPFQLSDGQVVEASVQGYTGEVVVSGAEIRPLGVGDLIEPDGTGGTRGFRDQRVAGTFVWYPQPFGFQAEWSVGNGPGLNAAQTEVELRSLHGGYLMAVYRHDTPEYGIVTPYARWQYFRGGYRSAANAPFGTHEQWDLGVEWQIRREMELVVEYSLVDGVTLGAKDREGARSYKQFDGGILRLQFQVNY
ncbi:MAG TPA: porin [Gemmataceae bacterium]|nr:porin [Gemmataceae bacterium]